MQGVTLWLFHDVQWTHCYGIITKIILVWGKEKPVNSKGINCNNPIFLFLSWRRMVHKESFTVYYKHASVSTPMVMARYHWRRWTRLFVLLAPIPSLRTKSNARWPRSTPMAMASSTTTSMLLFARLVLTWRRRLPVSSYKIKFCIIKFCFYSLSLSSRSIEFLSPFLLINCGIFWNFNHPTQIIFLFVIPLCFSLLNMGGVRSCLSFSMKSYL